MGIAAQSPVLIVFEDAHWIDPTSLDLLDRTVARVANLPVLLVVTFRPEFQPTWVGQPHVTMLPLSRLGRRDSAGIIGGITKDKALPDVSRRADPCARRWRAAVHRGADEHAARERAAA